MPEYELAFIQNGRELLCYPLGDRTVIGRGSQSDLALPSADVSRTQALIERRDGAYHLVDRSGRGTRIDGTTVSEAILRDGTVLEFGSLRAVVRTRLSRDRVTTRAPGSTSVSEDEARPAVPVHLRVRSNGKERIVPLHGEACVIGRERGCDLVLAESFVSSRHARLDREGGRWVLTDIESRNGTFLQGARVERTELLPGTTFRIASVELTLEEDPLPADDPRRAPAFEGMVSLDPSMRAVFDLVARAASFDAPVVILGETGTGKELVARAIHRRSRRTGAFVALNCAAIAANLAESELFGHERGAFSGAERERKGAFLAADAGTLFLDEVGELPLDVQAKLLRAIELGEVKRVGADAPCHVKVRIVSATHVDLASAVEAGTFREDLYYRLRIVPIRVPPLRDRPSDIRPLAKHFLEQLKPRGSGLAWTEEALARLESHTWPGNVRELRGVVERGLCLRGGGGDLGPEVIQLDEKPDRLARAASGAPATLAEAEREAIRAALQRHGGNRTEAARALGIHRSLLRRRITEYGLEAEGKGQPDEDEAGDA